MSSANKTARLIAAIFLISAAIVLVPVFTSSSSPQIPLTSARLRPAVADAAVIPAAAPALAAVPAHAVRPHLSPHSPSAYTVRSGDTLSSISGDIYGNPGYWPALWEANKALVPDYNLIRTGQLLHVPPRPTSIPAAPAPVAPPAPAVPVTAAAVQSNSGDEPDGGQQPQQSSAPASSGDSSAGSTGGGYKAVGSGSIISDVQMVFGSGESCAVEILNHESGLQWSDVTIANASGAYGLPQALPGDKMASFGSDWATNPVTQLRWMQWYANTTYGSICNAAYHDISTGTY